MKKWIKPGIGIYLILAVLAGCQQIYETPKWELKATYHEGCSCNAPCPCPFGLPILVYLPNSYNNTYKSYPVIYLLDRETLFNSFTGVVDMLSSDASPQIPEMIVVGINTSQNRLRDASPTKSLIGYRGIKEDGLEVTGGADNFLKFIEIELIPHIDSSYRTFVDIRLQGYLYFILFLLKKIYLIHI